jgi:hypothetical protein
MNYTFHIWRQYVHSLCPKFFPHNLGPIYKPMISIQCHFIRNLIDMHLHIISEKAIATKPHMFSLLYLNSCWGLVSNYPSSTYLATKLLCLIRSYVIHFTYTYILLPIFSLQNLVPLISTIVGGCTYGKNL